MQEQRGGGLLSQFLLYMPTSKVGSKYELMHGSQFDEWSVLVCPQILDEPRTGYYFAAIYTKLFGYDHLECIPNI
jgi:hypothetical protein